MGESDTSSKRVVVVHQMGKVGSSAVYQALRERQEPRVEYTHMLNREAMSVFIRHKRAEGQAVPSHVRGSARVWRVIRRTDQPVDFVCAVRSLMARNISAMFQNLPAQFPKEPTPENLEELGRRFVQRYPHSTPLHWFDRQLHEPLGLDVYSQPFDHESKSLFLQRGRFRVLVLRAEDSNEIKQAALARHLGLSGLELGRENIAAEKGHGALYKAFVQSFTPPEHLTERCCQSRVCTHFYTAAEIDRFRSRWQGVVAADSEAA